MKDVYQVLIVEDDPMVAMINEQYLKRSRRFAVAGKCGDGRSACRNVPQDESREDPL